MEISFKHLKRMLVVLFIFVIGIFSLLLLILFFLSPGKPELITDKNGKFLSESISEKIFLTIGGIKQGMFIKSTNSKNPVLLYLHGGIPDYFLFQKFSAGLEDDFTVVWWEQRGSGLSYSRNIPAETMNLDQLISDTRELTNYLQTRFGQKKIYLMGRSGGSFIGIQAVTKFPELYHAYIGVGQMSDQLKSEKLAYTYMLKKYHEAKDRKMTTKLEASSVDNLVTDAYLKLRDRAMHNLGIGTTRQMNSIIRGIFIPSLICRDYTLREKFNLWRGKARSGVHPLWNTMIATDLAQKVTKIEIPVYFLHGISDYTVSYSLAKQFFEAIHAPKKGFYTFKNSAHSPIFEEPERVKEIIKTDILKLRISLSD